MCCQAMDSVAVSLSIFDRSNKKGPHTPTPPAAAAASATCFRARNGSLFGSEPSVTRLLVV